MRYFLIFFLVFCLSLGAVSVAQAVAIKVSPPKIETEVELEILTEEEILVENPGDNVALFEVYLDNFSDWIKVKPKSFTLESKKSKKVVLEIERKEEGSFSTHISVVAKPLSSRKFKSSPGVKIPLNIRVGRERNNLLAGLISFFHFKKSICISMLIGILSVLVLFLAFRREIGRVL